MHDRVNNNTFHGAARRTAPLKLWKQQVIDTLLIIILCVIMRFVPGLSESARTGHDLVRSPAILSGNNFIYL